MKILISPGVFIEESSMQEEFVRSSGPGGQNVNKVSSAVVLRFTVGQSGLPPEVAERLKILAGKRLNAAGEVVLKGQEFRNQDKNRVAVRERLMELLREAARPPVLRRPTRQSRASKARILEAKRHRGLVKQSRNRKILPDG